MRILLATLPLLSLAACGGGGVQTIGSNAVSGNPGAGLGGSQSGTPHSFVAPTAAKTYQAIGSSHSFQYSTDDRTNLGGDPISGQYNQLYAGNASTARNSAITVSYDPRDAIFKVEIVDPLSNVSEELRFQDPLHRTAFGGVLAPQDGVPDLTSNGVRYLESGTASGSRVYDPAQSTTIPIGNAEASVDTSTFFYQLPGTQTKYVTFAGYARNRASVEEVQPPGDPAYLRQNVDIDRAAFVFGERTPNNGVPTTGSASYNGTMLGTMVYNPGVDTLGPLASPTFFQWINGTAAATVDFAARNLNVALNGTVSAPMYDVYTTQFVAAPAGSAFSASASASIDMVNAGGFAGQFSAASVAGTAVNIAGSSIDGTFYGPAAQEIGGGFRIVGGTPDERIDILGAFTGAR